MTSVGLFGCLSDIQDGQSLEVRFQSTQLLCILVQDCDYYAGLSDREGFARKGAHTAIKSAIGETLSTRLVAAVKGVRVYFRHSTGVVSQGCPCVLKT